MLEGGGAGGWYPTLVGGAIEHKTLNIQLCIYLYSCIHVSVYSPGPGGGGGAGATGAIGGGGGAAGVYTGGGPTGATGATTHK